MSAVTPSPPADPAFLDIQAVAAMLHCSPRHVTRQVKEGRMPAPVKFGRLSRWPRAALEAWIVAGCPCPTEPSASQNLN